MIPPQQITDASSYLEPNVSDYGTYTPFECSGGSPYYFSGHFDWSHTSTDEPSSFESGMEIQELSGNYLAADFNAAANAESVYEDAFSMSSMPVDAIENSAPCRVDYSLYNDVPLEDGMSLFHTPVVPSALPTCISPSLIELRAMDPSPSQHCAWTSNSPDSTDVRYASHPYYSALPSSASSSSSGSLSPPPSDSPSLSLSAPAFVSAASQPLLRSFLRRNKQVVPSSKMSSTSHENPWKCPHCPYLQRNKRSPDLKRHIATHTRAADVEAWVCCGIPVDEAAAWGVPAEYVHDAAPYQYAGRWMVGGCRKTFSRRDALKRHLRREEGRCYGDALAPYLPGNSR